MLYILFLVGLIGLCSGLILNVRLKSRVSKRLFFLWSWFDACSDSPCYHRVPDLGDAR
jgi:hypothetical protein